nr:hypothetical protein [Tanacetum cinerariifolium]
MYREWLTEFWYSGKDLENSKVYFLTPTGGIYGKVGVNTFRNAISAHYLPYSSEYVAPPSIDIVRPWFKTTRYGEAIPTKGTLKKSLFPPRWRLLMTQIIQCLGEPPFSNHMLAICAADTPMVLKAPKPSYNAERVPQGTKTGAKPEHKKHSTSLKQSTVSSKEATKGGSSKAPIASKTSLSKKRKCLARPWTQTQASLQFLHLWMMHKEDQQATDCPTSLGVTSEERANPQLNSVILPQQHGMNEGTNNTSYDHLFTGMDQHVLADQTKSVGEGLETVLTQPITGKGASSVARKIKEETSNTIKLEYLAKLVSHVQPSFKDLDSPKDDPVIIVDDIDEDEEDEIHAATNNETEDTLVPKFSSQSSQIQELTNQVLILQSQKHKMELEKNKAEAKVALLKAQPSNPNVKQLNELLVASVQAKLKTLDALPCILLNITQDLNKFAQEAEKESIDSDSDNETYVTSSMVEPSRTKKLKKFDFITEDGRHIHLTEEEINHQKKLKEDAKAKAAKQEREVRKAELVDLLGPKVVKKYYNDKL